MLHLHFSLQTSSPNFPTYYLRISDNTSTLLGRTDSVTVLNARSSSFSRSVGLRWTPMLAKSKDVVVDVWRQDYARGEWVGKCVFPLNDTMKTAFSYKKAKKGTKEAIPGVWVGCRSSEELGGMGDSISFYCKAKLLKCGEDSSCWFDLKDEKGREVYKSECVSGMGNSPIWNPVNIPAASVGMGERMRLMFYEEGGGVIGEAGITVQDVMAQRKNIFILNPNRENSVTIPTQHDGVIDVVYSQIAHVPSFFEYLCGGMRLNVVLGLDFTKSTLHQGRGDLKVDNACTTTIRTLCSILADFDENKLIQVFGLGGARPNPHSPPSHCFALNGNEQTPDVYDVLGVLEAYHSSQVLMESDETLVEPLIRRAIDEAKALMHSKERLVYTVLVILMNAPMEDLPETINALVDAADVPMSVIMIGLGESNFAPAMGILNVDELISSDGLKCPRDIVTFVALDRLRECTPEILSQEALGKLPAQIVSFFTNHDVFPGKPFLASTLRHTASSSEASDDVFVPMSHTPSPKPILVPLQQMTDYGLELLNRSFTAIEDEQHVLL